MHGSERTEENSVISVLSRIKDRAKPENEKTCSRTQIPSNSLFLWHSFYKEEKQWCYFFRRSKLLQQLKYFLLAITCFLKSSESLIHYQQYRAIWAGEKQTDGIRSKHWFCSGYWNLLVLALLPWELQLIKYLKLFFFLSDKNQIVRVASYPTSLFSEGCVFDCPHLKTICLRFQMSPPLRALFNRFVIT